MQSSRSVYEALLTEINKVNAPALLLEDFNYFFNKAINQYINKKYNIYDVNQQSTDDLRVLKSTALLDVYKPWDQDNASEAAKINRQIYGAYYEAVLPQDYLHMLNCVLLYKVKKQFKCYNAGSIWKQGATRLTADSINQILNNAYRRPSYRNPYYYITNVNTSELISTNPVKTIATIKFADGSTRSNVKIGTDVEISKNTAANATTENTNNNAVAYSAATSKEEEDWKETYGTNANLRSGEENIDDQTKASQLNIVRLPETLINSSVEGIDLYNPEEGIRYGNKTSVVLQIRYGEDDSLFELYKIAVDYIKTPQYIRLTQDQLDTTVDTSQILEWPDNVVQQIISELTMIVLENASDPRLQTNIPVNQSIANPVAQQQAPQQ